MKGFLLLPKYIFLVIFLIVSVIFFVGVEAVAKAVSLRASTEVNVNYLYRPVKTEDALLSFLETTDENGVRVFDILEAVAVTRSKNVFVDGVGIDAEETLSGILSVYLTNFRFVLSDGAGDILVLESGDLPEDPGFAETYFTVDGKDYRVTLYA